MTAERVYRMLLRVYPSGFRSEYGREMTLIFRDEYRMRDATALAFWISMVWDVTHSAMSIWVDSWIARANNYTPILEAIMKIAGILAASLGVFGALNAVAEGVAMRGRGMLERPPLLAVVLGGVAGVLLIVAGAAVVRSTRSARNTATIALVASLLIVSIVRLTNPWMSELSELIGIALPVALLAVLHWPRRHDDSSASPA